jgi:hypothetical protein
MQRNKSSQKKRTNKKTQIEILLEGQNVQEVMVIPRALGWAARRLRCTLRYSTTGLLNNAAVARANSRYNPVNVYDVDPTLGSTSCPGFTEYGQIYRLYRTRSSTCKVTFSNKEIFPVCCYLCPVNTDPGANNATPQTYLSNKLCKERTVGPLTGNGLCALRDHQTTCDFAGVLDTQQIDTYCGFTNGGTAPTNAWYWMVGVVTDGTVMSAGVLINVIIEIEVEFFELLSPSA